MVAPVVLIAFNRPDHTRRTLAAIREARPDQLLLIVDAPREGVADDAAKVRDVKAVLDEIDWPCEVHRRYADVNQGVAANIELGLDWAFSIVDRAVVLEDDCLADPTFFAFCTELLDRYAQDDRVAYIGGAAPEVAPDAFAGNSYAFTAFASIWGWATWARAWQHHRRLFPRTHARGDDDARRTVPLDLAKAQLVSPAARRFFGSSADILDPRNTTWAIHWVLTTLAEGSLTATAATTLVQNIGTGAGGTNTQSDRPMPAARPLELPLIHPPVQLNPTIEAAFEKTVTREFGLLARTARKVLPKGPIRALVRAWHYRRTA